MLASLLPGLRELRTPLAAGYIWLATLWLVLRDSPPDSFISSNLVADLTRLSDWIGRATFGVALSFIAYLLGVLSLMVSTLASRSRRFQAPSALGRSMLREVVLDRLDDRAADQPDFCKRAEELLRSQGQTNETPRGIRRLAAGVSVDVERLVDAFVDDLPLMPKRLLGDERERELYGEYDRLRQEAEFRAAISFPIAALFISLGVLEQGWWFWGTVVAVLIALDGAQKLRSSTDLLAEAVLARRPESPAMSQVSAKPLPLNSWDVVVDRAAAMGFSGAEYEKGCYLEQLEGSREAALPWHERAADKGHVSAMAHAGELSLAIGDTTRARRWLVRAAMAENQYAIARLRDLAASDPKTMRDLAGVLRALGQQDQAIQWLTMSSERGEVTAMVDLVQLLDDDDPDRDKWLARAAKLGHPYATRTLSS